MINKSLQEKFNYHKEDHRNDMWFHFPILNSIARDSNVIIELGTRGIVSTWAFLHGLADTNERVISVREDRRELLTQPAKALWSYDINHPKEYGADIEEIQKIAKENNVEWRFIQENTLETEIPSCDAIFFDTDHTYDQLSQELKLHGHKSRKYLIFHDTMKYATELIPAINEFLEEHEEWRILHCENTCHGCTILVKASLSRIDEWVNRDIKRINL